MTPASSKCMSAVDMGDDILPLGLEPQACYAFSMIGTEQLQKIRLFIAISIPDTITPSLISLQQGLTEIRWIPPRNFHITLAFLGELPHTLIPDIKQAICAIHLPPFTIHLENVRYWNPSIVWTAVTPADAVYPLKKAVDQAVDKIGISLDTRPFTPHVTLGRLRNREPEPTALIPYMEKHQHFLSPTFPVSEFTLFQSLNGENTPPHYIPLCTVALGAV